MIDFTKIEEFTAEYVVPGEQKINTYNQAKDKLKVSSDGQSITVSMKSEQNKENVKPFDMRIIKKGSGYEIVHDLFENDTIHYPLTIKKDGDDEFLLVHKYENEIMHIHVYYK